MYLLRDVDTEEAKNGVAFEAASAFLTIRIRRRQYIRMIFIFGGFAIISMRNEI